MSVKVSLEFKSVDEAIVALGKLVGAPIPKPEVAGKTGSDVASPAANVASAAPTTPRKPRSDAGKPRGPHKNAGGDQGGTQPTGTTGAPTPAAPVPPPAPVNAAPKQEEPKSVAEGQHVPPAPAPAAAPVPTPEEVQAAVERFFANGKLGGYDNTLALLSRYGVKRGKDLLPEQRAEFIADVDAILAGKKTI